MNIIREWTLCVCSTVIAAVVFSLLTPKGNNGKFYKTVISLFIFVSFIFPFVQNSGKALDFDFKPVQIETKNTTNSIANEVVKREIISLLESNSVFGSSVTCSSEVNKNNEVTLNDITVAVTDEYNREEVRQLIYDELSLNVRVIYVGE